MATKNKKIDEFYQGIKGFSIIGARENRPTTTIIHQLIRTPSRPGKEREVNNG